MAEYAQIFTSSPQLTQKVQSVYNQTGQSTKNAPEHVQVDDLFFDDAIIVNAPR